MQNYTLNTNLELEYSFKDLLERYPTLNWIFPTIVKWLKVNQCVCNLGFIKRTCHTFNDPTALKTLLFVPISNFAL